MRLTNFLLVAAAALLASCEAVSAATESAQSSIKKSTPPPGMARLIDAVHDGKRFLRTTKKEKYEGEDSDNDLDYEDDDADDDDNDSEDEERGFRFTTKTDDEIRAKINNIPGGNTKIVGWKEQEYGPSDVKSLLGLTDTKSLQDPDVRLYKLFSAIHAKENFKLN